MASSTVIQSAPPSAVRDFFRRLKAGEEFSYLLTLAAATLVLLIVGLIVYELVINSTESFHKFGWSFFVTSVWDPNNDQYGALPFIYGTCVTSALGLLLAVPAGVGAALFLAEMAPPRLSAICVFMIELLA